MKQWILRLLVSLWIPLKKLLPDFGKVGTHIHIGLTVLVLIYLLITRPTAKQVDANTHKIEQVAKAVIDYRDSLRISDQAKNVRIDSMEKEVKRMREITLKQDRAVAQVLKDLAELKTSRNKALQAIEGMTDQQLVDYFQSKTLKKK